MNEMAEGFQYYHVGSRSKPQQLFLAFSEDTVIEQFTIRIKNFIKLSTI